MLLNGNSLHAYEFHAIEYMKREQLEHPWGILLNAARQEPEKLAATYRRADLIRQRLHYEEALRQVLSPAAAARAIADSIIIARLRDAVLLQIDYDGSEWLAQQVD